MNEIRRDVMTAGPLRAAICWLLDRQDRVTADELGTVAGVDPSRAAAYLTSLQAGKVVRYEDGVAKRSRRWAYWASDRPAKMRNPTRRGPEKDRRERLNWRMRCLIQARINQECARQDLSVLGLARKACVDDRMLRDYLHSRRNLSAEDLIRVCQVICLDVLAETAPVVATT